MGFGGIPVLVISWNREYARIPRLLVWPDAGAAGFFHAGADLSPCAPAQGYPEAAQSRESGYINCTRVAP